MTKKHACQFDNGALHKCVKNFQAVKEGYIHIPLVRRLRNSKFHAEDCLERAFFSRIVCAGCAGMTGSVSTCGRVVAGVCRILTQIRRVVNRIPVMAVRKNSTKWR